MDDLFILTDMVEEHLQILEDLLWRLRQVGLRISPTKAHSLQSLVKYLGYIIDKYGVRADPKKMEALVKLPPPMNVKGVRTIMGGFSYYRCFVNNFSKLVMFIIELLRKDEPFVWDNRRQDALDALKVALLKNAIVYAPDPHKPFILCLDASDFAIGGMVSQRTNDGFARPCVLMSKTLKTVKTDIIAMKKRFWHS